MINSGTNLTHFSIIFLTHVAKHFLRSTPLTGNKDVPQANGKGVGSINPPPPRPAIPTRCVCNQKHTLGRPPMVHSTSLVNQCQSYQSLGSQH